MLCGLVLIFCSNTLKGTQDLINYPLAKIGEFQVTLDPKTIKFDTFTIAIEPKKIEISPLEICIAPSTLRLSASLTLLISGIMLGSYLAYKGKYKEALGTIALSGVGIVLIKSEKI